MPPTSLHHNLIDFFWILIYLKIRTLSALILAILQMEKHVNKLLFD